MPLYEVMCIATVQSTPAQLVNSLQRLAVVVQKGKGVFRRVEHLGTRPLAYRMKAHMKYNTVGRYFRLFVQASPLLIRDLETRLRVDDHIVKTLTIKHKQDAPVVLEKRNRHLKMRNLTSTTGVLTHAPTVEYEAAKVLLALNYLRPEDILDLPRHDPDPTWEAQRQAEILRRAHGGSDAARAILQLPVPTRQEDLALMKKLGDAEEEELRAYEVYRKQRNLRQLADQQAYNEEEERALARRMEWYQRSGQAMRERKLAKKLNNHKKVHDPEKIRALVRDHPMRWQRGGKPVPPPAWAVADAAKEAGSSASASASTAQ